MSLVYARRVLLGLQLVSAISVLAGCGRIGVKPLGEDAGYDEDAGVPDDELDGEVIDMDGGVEDAEADDDESSMGLPDASDGSDAADDAQTDSCSASTGDTTCNGVDEDCNGVADDDYLPSATSCGVGVCTRSGTLACMAGAVRDTCVAGAPSATVDDAAGSGNGLDDDCDGQIDEDVSACDSTPRTFDVGVHSNIAVPRGCSRATVQLWGGAGAAGAQGGISTPADGGRGGSGGYASSTLMLTGPLTLWIGSGGASGCNAGGANAGSASYAGGSGGLSRGGAGADGVVAGGGSGANPTLGEDGGRGHFGGGGGGGSASDPANGPSQSGGGGGAASVVLLNGARVMVAGGGGGGGGAAPLVYNFGEVGGHGGEGCSGAGNNGETARGGGGGGGGVCMGASVMAGADGLPANAASVPAPRARGTNSNCGAGGNGYAIITFAR